MKPTTKILDRIRKNTERNNEEVFTRLYRYMLRPDMYYRAYQNLYANKGAATRGDASGRYPQTDSPEEKDKRNHISYY